VEKAIVGDETDGHTASLGRVAQRVLDQVLEHALHHADVALDERKVGGGAGLEPHAPLGGAQMELLDDVLDELAQ
jgi:hypothetical protein